MPFLNYTGNFSENCLTLSVVRPSGIDPNAKLPVAVWIYEGFYIEVSSLFLDTISHILWTHRNPHQHLLSQFPLTIVSRISVFFRAQDLQRKEIPTWESTINVSHCTWYRRILRHLVETLRKWQSLDSLCTIPSRIENDESEAVSVSTHMIAYGGRVDKLFRGAIFGEWEFVDVGWISMG